MVAEQGYGFELLPYVVETVADFESFRDLLYKRVRWMTVMRHMRPWGHFGLMFTQGLPWAVLAFTIHPTLSVAGIYFGGYLACRFLMTGLVGSWGLRQRRLWKKLPLIPVWDAISFLIWVSSFARRTIRWRGVDYKLRQGTFEATETPSGGIAVSQRES
jgi:ceramide glucosyltransferase